MDEPEGGAKRPVPIETIDDIPIDEPQVPTDTVTKGRINQVNNIMYTR